ncbi:MAG: caspase family protein, partial [Inquilinus sp.]|nr:caspase family protein [Inquilinus sp.]
MRCRFAGVLALVAALFAIALAAPPAAAQRVALVVGNGAYTHTPALPNAANDGRAMAAALRGLGFEVIEGIDLDRRAMEDRLRAFARAVRGGEVGLFFYAGHGLQVDGRNYLLPVDARLEDESDLAFETLALDFVLDQLDRSVGTGLVFLDACRDNPLSRSLARGMSATRSAAIGRGLARIDGGIGTLIAYATEPDAVALDGDGPNSPFTTALLRHIGAPGLEVRQMLTRVRQDVIEQTRRQQVPWDHSSLTDAFYFKPAAAPATAPATAATAGGGGAELRLWDAAQSVAPPDRRIEALELYLETYPQGRFAAMAGVQIAAARQQLAGTAERGLAVQAVTPEPEIAAAPDPAAVETAIGLSRDQRRLAQRA